MEIRFRAAKKDDSSLLLSWRNSPEAIKNSISKKVVSQKKHSLWYQNRISRADFEPFWIFLLGNRPVGTARLDLIPTEKNTFEISIFVDPTHHGIGIGREILDLTCIEFLKSPEKTIIAKILNSNLASKKLFLGAGFTVTSVNNNILVLKKTLKDSL